MFTPPSRIVGLEEKSFERSRRDDQGLARRRRGRNGDAEL